MFYVINLAPSRFCRQLDASVSSLFASFKYALHDLSSKQGPHVFHVNQCFSWQSLDLFLGLFSPPGRPLNLGSR